MSRLIHKRKINKNLKRVIGIAVPITIQNVIQSSLSLVDQVMVGQLGVTSIAAVAVGGKFSYLLIMTLSAIFNCTSIMLAQFYGNKDYKSANRSIKINFCFAIVLFAIFTMFGVLCPSRIAQIYTSNAQTIALAASYIRITAFGYISLAITNVLYPVFRNVGLARYAMYASLSALVANTILNFLLIFGFSGIPAMGVYGAALATTLSRYIELIIAVSLFFIKVHKQFRIKVFSNLHIKKSFIKKTFIIFLPIFITQFLWSLGDMAFSMIYGHIGVEEFAVMSLTYPLQGLATALFTGLSSSAGIISGNLLGKNKRRACVLITKRFIIYTIFSSIIVGIILILLSPFYCRLFSLSDQGAETLHILIILFSVFLVVKVFNMVNDTIINSGGRTKIIAYINFMGMLLGVIIGVVSAFVLNLSITWVYFLITLEEVFRMALGIYIYRSQSWINNFASNSESHKNQIITHEEEIDLQDK